MLLGILLAILVGPVGFTQEARKEKANANVGNLFGGGRADKETAQEKWRKAHNVTEKQWQEMISNFEARKKPAPVGEADWLNDSTSEWWEIAKDKTPAQVNALYPPLQPHEWYRAEWVGGWSDSRELDDDFDFRTRRRTYKLTLMLSVRTEPEVPIKELHGRIAFESKGKSIYETDLAEIPDVSFTNRCLVLLQIDPYDDSDATHRTLRYSKDDELTPVFRVTKVILADGTERVFDAENK